MIYWVFGGTAVGKKRFIRKVLRERPAFMAGSSSLQSAWMADGEITEDDRLLMSEPGDVLVRWQHGREELLARLAPNFKQSIFMLTANLVAQLSRVALREGDLKWDASLLTGETNGIHELVSELSRKYQIPVVYVDTSSSSEYVMRWRTV